MKRFFCASSTLLILFLALPYVNSGAFGEPESLVNSSITHLFQLRVIFVGFNESVVNTDLINSTIQHDYSFIHGDYTINYNFNISYHFADSSYPEALKTFILANSVNGTNTTSSLNTTALQIQRSTGSKMSIFLPQSGRAIDAEAVETWFEENPYEAESTDSYQFYVMNFTEFDSPNHVLEHWYNVTELDHEANRNRDFWRLEWDNHLNPNVRFPYSCFTSQSRIFFIDPSAFQWYLTWTRIWWGLSVSGPKYDYYYEDLDQFLMTHNVGTIEGKEDLAYYLAGWIDDALTNLLAPDLWTDLDLAKASSLSIQVLVLNNASQSGYSEESISWIVNSSLAVQFIEDLAPFLETEVTVEFENISDYPLLEAIFDGAVDEKRDGWIYYDGNAIWGGLYALRDSYFDLNAADVVINAYVYLEKNMSMMYAGGEYTGLGGGGQILVMKELGRYFSGSASRRSGLGLVLIHEAGHNLGFPHTFIHGNAYAGDFAFDVMGYYPYSYSFTQMRKDAFHRLVVDLRILELQNQLEEDLLLYNRQNSTETIDAEFDTIHLRLNETLQLYDEMNYLLALENVIEAEALEIELQDLLWIYLCDFTGDGKVSIFDIVIAAGAYGATPGDSNWNPDADLIEDGEIDIFDIMIMVDNYAKKWRE